MSALHKDAHKKDAKHKKLLTLLCIVYNHPATLYKVSKVIVKETDIDFACGSIELAPILDRSLVLSLNSLNPPPSKNIFVTIQCECICKNTYTLWTSHPSSQIVCVSQLRIVYLITLLTVVDLVRAVCTF